MSHVQGIRPGTSNLYYGLNKLFKGIEEGSGTVPGVGELAQKYFKTLGDYTLKNMAPSLRYRDEDFIQTKDDIQREYEKDLKNNSFTFGPMERNPDGSIKKYEPGSLGPKSIAQVKNITRPPVLINKIHPVLEDIVSLRDMPLTPLSPANPNDSDWLPYGISRDPHIGVLWAKNRNEDLNFISDINTNPNASFATTGFSKAVNVREPKKIYRVSI